MSHLSLSDRIIIETRLNEKVSIVNIAKELEKSPTTIRREILKHRIEKETLGRGVHFNPCVNCSQCAVRDLCSDCKARGKNRKCAFCANVRCWEICKDYKEYECEKLKILPFVCNACATRARCRVRKWLYKADEAYDKYKKLLTESRQGFNIKEEEALEFCNRIRPLIKQGQSFHVIYTNNADWIPVSEKTMYRYEQAHFFNTFGSDMPRKMRFSPRKSKPELKVDKKCRVGRDYKAFKDFIKANPDIPIVQMDSVVGNVGGKVLLTLFFTNCKLQLAFIRDHNDSKSVSENFERLRDILGDDFIRLFPVILTDNGTEFSNPTKIEFNEDGFKVSQVFYCDPYSSFQKGGAEKNHEEIRMILPKGYSFDNLTQEDIDLVMSHVNSYARHSIGDKTPYEVFEAMYGKGILEKLNIRRIAPNDVIMKPKLLGEKSIVL